MIEQDPRGLVHDGSSVGFPSATTFPKTIAFDVVPFAGNLVDDGLFETDEEKRLRNETATVFHGAADLQETAAPPEWGEEMLLSPYADWLTTGEISAHFSQICGISASKKAMSRTTDKVIHEMEEWSARRPSEGYSAVFVDPIVAKIRNCQVAN